MYNFNGLALNRSLILRLSLTLSILGLFIACAGNPSPTPTPADNEIVEDILEEMFWSYAEVSGATKEDGFQYARDRIYDDLALDWLRHDKELQYIFGSDRDTFEQYPWCITQLGSFHNLQSLEVSETPSEAAIRVSNFLDVAELWRTDIIAAEEVKLSLIHI